MHAETFLAVTRVRKQYATVLAVDDISFNVRRGEIVALLGPNGAGKTTLLRMLVRITHPDSGSIQWEGTDAPISPLSLGYLPEDRGLYQEMPIRKTLTYFARLRGVAAPQAAQRADEWLERLGLLDRAGEKLGALSKGNQQKVQFAAAVLHGPRMAILDEPFSGLDPVNQEAFLDIVRELRDAGTTVLLSAHQMSLVERVADRVFVMHRGRELLHAATTELMSGGSLHDVYVDRVRAADTAWASAQGVTA